MSNEVEILENPTSTPELVSTGYQRQNTNIVAGRTGIDSSYVEGGVGQVTAYISGPIDVNGILYNIKSNTVLNPATAGRWFIYLDESGSEPQYLTPTLTQVSGSFDASKNARYTSGLRILNWIIDYDGTDCIVERWFTPESDDQNYIEGLDVQPETWIKTNTTWVAPRSKYYTLYVTGSGGSGGGSTSGSAQTGGGGGAGATGIKRMFINAGDAWTSTLTTSSGGNCTFTDGSTTLQVQNGSNGSSLNGQLAGQGGLSSTGFDETFQGGGGHNGIIYTYNGTSGDYISGGCGGSSFYGGGGRGGAVTSSGSSSGSAGGSYGAGGGGGARTSGGSGAQGVIRIIG